MIGELSMADRFLSLAPAELGERCRQQLRRASGVDGWMGLQGAFLDMVDRYLEGECAKDVELNIGDHEAGGQWRIAFPHALVRPDAAVEQRMNETLTARRRFTDRTYFHGYPDCTEVHHEIETFIYFQMPLYYHGMAGSDDALRSIEDVAHHAGNWVEQVPDWYDWSARGFRSIWFGTKEVRAHPPYDYQEGNHFRLLEAALAVYRGTGEQRYLDLAVSYAGRWCEHIERRAGTGDAIPCAILPEGAVGGEGAVARWENLSGQYKVLYTSASVFAAYDIAGALMDLFRLTADRRYLYAAGALIDQFFEHGEGGRPATMFTKGRWARAEAERDLTQVKSFVSDDVSQAAWMLSFLALEHDATTGGDGHRRWIVDWARAVDEDSVADDQMMSAVLVAAHDYDGDPGWLRRAYAMALRTAAVVEPDDRFHQCSALCRQGSKAMMETLYQPLLGACDWGTRGGLPFGGIRHEVNGRGGLPDGVALRVWNTRGQEWRFQAHNRGAAPAAWRLRSDRPGWHIDRIVAQDDGGAAMPEVHVAPGQTVSGSILWAGTH